MINRTAASRQQMNNNNNNNNNSNNKVATTVGQPKMANAGKTRTKKKKKQKKKKPFLMYIVLQSLVGQPVCLEIKNDDEVHGTIEAVDRDMNVSLLDVTYIFARVS